MMRNQHISKTMPRKTVTCYKCGIEGHKSNACFNNNNNNKSNSSSKWCKFCRSTTHNTQNCRKVEKANMVQNSKLKNDVEDSSFVFMVTQDGNSMESNMNSFLVDCGATSHIVIDDSNFIKVDEHFKPNEHFIELADGSKSNDIALKRGSVAINLQDSRGKVHNITLENVLFIPSYPQNIFSVQAATTKGASINFYPNSAELVSNGTTFNIKKEGKLYFLLNDLTYVKSIKDLKEWHGILGHCNQSDILKLQNIVDGMKIGDKDTFDCESCVLGKQV